MSNVAQAICVVSVKDCAIRYANPTFERMFGYRSNELDGKPFRVINFEVDDQSYSQIAKLITHQLNKLGEVICEIRNVRKDGTSFWCRVHTVQIDNSEFGLVRVITYEDIKHQRAIENNIWKPKIETKQQSERWRIVGKYH
jgi:PAS domain S-box-containing protein